MFDKEILEKKIKALRNKFFIGTMLASSILPGKANAEEKKSDSSEEKEKIQSLVQKNQQSDDGKTFVASSDVFSNVDTLSVKEYNKQSIEKADPAVKALVAMVEGFQDKAYRCAAKVPTFGYGNTAIGKSGRAVKMTDRISNLTKFAPGMTAEEKKDAILSKGMELVDGHLDKYVYSTILENVNVKLEPNQIAAVASLIYNIGNGGFKKSEVLKEINSGGDVSKAFLNHTFASGSFNSGLAKRRVFEMALYENPTLMSQIPKLQKGACYLYNPQNLIQEDVSSFSKFKLAAKKKNISIKKGIELEQAMEKIISEQKGKEIEDILPKELTAKLKESVKDNKRDNILVENITRELLKPNLLEVKSKLAEKAFSQISMANIKASKGKTL